MFKSYITDELDNNIIVFYHCLVVHLHILYDMEIAAPRRGANFFTKLGTDVKLLKGNN